MSSIIEGYNYDIFISYRQKDNQPTPSYGWQSKGDRWVSEFVDSLKTELESTFKEEISVYFDINPHDGLLETHDVDASLKDKLKCLIFIPIISRTYCDPKSFAWEHEFKAFVELASQDQLGMKIKLPNGNVANRMIPVQIHDLYPEDKALIERELGGILRAIEFIYKESGVNKPLTAIDNEKKNLNNTTYRIQINKVANAIDEIIHSLKGKQATSDDRKLSADHTNFSKEEDKRNELSRTTMIKQKSQQWIIMLFSVILCIVGAFVVFKIIDSSKKNNDIAKLEKSIAVLPFVNDSPDQENAYFINGIMDEILNNLQKIKDFRVLSRTSTEQFRGSTKPAIPEIAKKLDVNFIVEGSGQKYGNKFVLRVQLIATKNEKHLWGESFEREIKETSDIINLQSQIAKSIAEELKASITPEEKQLIGQISTTNLTAYDFYQRGREELWKYFEDNNKQTLLRAEDLYKKALEYDSTFARAYVGLADVYDDKHYNEEYFSRNFLDSVLILTNIALSYDDHLAEAYLSRAGYYINNNKIEQAIKEYDKAIKYNPNLWEAYLDKGTNVYLISNNADFVNAIENIHKAASINPGKELPECLRALGGAYGSYAGFLEKGKEYFDKALKLDGDTTAYYSTLIQFESATGNFEEALRLSQERYNVDSTDIGIIYNIGYQYLFLGKFKESFKWMKKYFEYSKTLKEKPLLITVQWVACAYWQNGYKKEAEYLFNEQKKSSEESIKMGRDYVLWGGAFYDLAGVYVALGDKEKAYENLKMVAKIPICPYWRTIDIKYDPLFNSIRNEPEFQQIVKDVESKYQAEHERVRKWLEEQGKL